MSLLVLSGCAATVNNKPDSTLTDNSDSQVTIISDQTAVVTNIGDQTATKFKYDEEIQKIVRDYKNEGTIISDEQVQKLNELYYSKKVDPTWLRLWYEEGIIIGDVDPNAPKLDLATVKDIIAKADSFKEIMSEFDKIQEYPDCVHCGSGLSAYIYSFNTHEGIWIIYEQREINYYETFTSDGTLNISEKLYG